MIDKSNIGGSMNTGEELVLDEVYNTTVQEYVEIIHDLLKEHRVARVKDIASERGVTRSSVSTAMSNLRDMGLVDHEHYGYVSLTDDGRRLGDVLAQRHGVILRFLRDVLGLEPGAADREACILEHTMSPESLNALVRHIHTVERCPECGPEAKKQGQAV